MTNYNDMLDRRFHALADPTRRAIVERLGLGPTAVSDLAAPLPMTLPSVMQHLKLLEDCSLVRSEKSGRTRTCHLDIRGLHAMDLWISKRLLLWQRRLYLLDEVLTGNRN